MIYSFKFLWAPLVDRARVPVLTAWLGHRRSWMLVCQALIMLGLWLVAGTDPATGLATVAIFAVLVGFFSATQDIAIDAWRIEAAEISRQGAMAAAYQWGYRGRDARGGRGAAAARRILRLELLVRGDGRADDGGGRGGAGRPARGAAIRFGPSMPKTSIRAPVLEVLEWAARLAVLALGALLLGSGLTANAGALARVLTALGATGARDAVCRPGRRRPRLGPPARRGIGLRRDRSCHLAASRCPHATWRLSVRRAGRSVTGFLRALRLRRGAHPGAHLPVPPPGLRAEHHESVLYRSRVHAGGDRRSPEDLRRRDDDGGRSRRRLCGGALWVPARAGDRRLRRAAQQSDLRLAGHAGPRPVRACHCHRNRERHVGLCRDLSHRVHVEPDLRWVHRHPICAPVIAVRDSRPHHRVAIGTHRRRRCERRGCGWRVVASE